MVLSMRVPRLGVQLRRFAFDVIERSDARECLGGEGTLVGLVQFEEIASRKRPARQLAHRRGLEQMFVARVVIDDQGTAIVFKEPSGIGSTATGGEVKHDDRLFPDLATSIGEQIRGLGLAVSRRQHLHRRFVGVEDTASIQLVQ